ncbi:hypothetical protein PJF56_15265 [Roseofilum sp. BLCC_M91]|uniref:Uncharacterized protein n=1 Tax=Roseofilum halophilum BLCC-M91 TaxID=3022259 RepID=A0ABT7BLZ5_9CYAN|nr:hypothetical protein [Roseofilum halophilum]MDJ1180222.1 hypothetical protein [Roseofilum halophilum BLCC-M91]
MYDCSISDRSRDGSHYRPPTPPRNRVSAISSDAQPPGLRNPVSKPCERRSLLIPKDRETPASPQHSVRGQIGESSPVCR